MNLHLSDLDELSQGATNIDTHRLKENILTTFN